MPTRYPSRLFVALFAAVALSGLLLSMTHVAAVHAQGERPSTVQLNDNVPMTYTVKKGDTLWDISQIYLREPWRWPELWDNNPQIDNPHLIYPGDVLALRWENGRPRLGLARRGDVKLSPQIRSEALSTAIPPIPRDQIDPFLRGHRVVNPEDFERAPYIIAGDAERLISGLGDRVYARGPMDATDRTHILLREDTPIVDPITNEILGLQVLDIGTTSIVAAPTEEFTDEEVKTLEITRMTEEVRIGDRMLPIEEGILDAFFQPKAPDVKLENGYMVNVAGGVTQIGQMNIVTLNLGAREGLELGDVLSIYQTGEVVRDPVVEDMVALPDVRAGLLMVFAVFEKASYGLVLKASRPLAVGDKVKNP